MVDVISIWRWDRVDLERVDNLGPLQCRKRAERGIERGKSQINAYQSGTVQLRGSGRTCMICEDTWAFEV